MPIRIRLAGLFTAAVLLLIGAGGVLFITQLRSGLQDSQDATLRARAEALIASLGDEPADGARLATGAGAYAQLLDGHGGVLRSSAGLAAAPLLTPTQAAAAVRGPLVTDVTATLTAPDQRGPEGMRLLAEPAGRPGQALAVVAPRDAVDDPVGQATEQLVILGVVVLILAGPAAWLLTRAALRPVERLRTQAAQLQTHDASSGLPVPGTHDEIARLAVTLNALLGRLHDALARERGFVADAGHELRTPLTVLKGELELARRPGRSRAQLAATVQVAAEETDRLARLADDLLLLARDSDTPLAQPEPLDLTALAHTAAEAARAAAVARAQTITVTATAPTPGWGDPGRLRQAVDNLLVNAVRYAHRGGTITIAPAVGAGHAELVVIDQGPGFPPEFLPVAFDRFARADTARTRNPTGDAGLTAGSGLGLAIVAAIMAAHHGSATAENTPDGGARVSLRWPVPAVDPSHVASTSS